MERTYRTDKLGIYRVGSQSRFAKVVGLPKAFSRHTYFVQQKGKNESHLRQLSGNMKGHTTWLPNKYVKLLKRETAIRRLTGK